MAVKYGAAWRRARDLFLKQNPVCAFHKARGHLVSATVVDHRVPHRGDETLFWDRRNWQALCKTCHDSHKQSQEKKGGVLRGATMDGSPLDPAHPWNTPGG
jgi:5-methylcytosine-specific restriction enzyme A